MMTIAGQRCLFVIFEMFVVGVRRTLFPSTREPDSHLEEEMAPTFGEGYSVDNHFCQWLVSISLQSTFASNISAKYTGSKSYHVRLSDSVYVLCRTSEQTSLL